jgi:hypothetical protein
MSDIDVKETVKAEYARLRCGRAQEALLRSFGARG